MNWQQALQAMQGGAKVRGGAVTAPQHLTLAVASGVYVMHDGRGNIIGRYMVTADDAAQENWEVVP